VATRALLASSALSRRVAGAAALATTLLAPAVAAACPYCAGRANGGSATLLTIAAFVSLPFLFAWAIYRVVRRGDGHPGERPRAFSDGGVGSVAGDHPDFNSRRGLSLPDADSSGSFPAYSASRRKA
jgi:hypothetical protein